MRCYSLSQLDGAPLLTNRVPAPGGGIICGYISDRHFADDDSSIDNLLVYTMFPVAVIVVIFLVTITFVVIRYTVRLNRYF